MEGGREDGKEGGRGGGADTELKTKTPHVNVGKNHYHCVRLPAGSRYEYKNRGTR